MGLGAFAVTMVVGLLTVTLGKITFVNPGILFDRLLDRSEQEFQNDMLAYAGNHYSNNQKLVDRKGHGATVLGVVFVVEVACFFVWIVQQL